MVDMQNIIEKLNSDPEAMKTFPADPVGFLAKEGIELPESAQKQLLAHVKIKQSAKPAWKDMCDFNSKS